MERKLLTLRDFNISQSANIVEVAEDFQTYIDHKQDTVLKAIG